MAVLYCIKVRVKDISAPGRRSSIMLAWCSRALLLPPVLLMCGLLSVAITAHTSSTHTHTGTHTHTHIRTQMHMRRNRQLRGPSEKSAYVFIVYRGRGIEVRIAFISKQMSTHGEIVFYLRYIYEPPTGIAISLPYVHQIDFWQTFFRCICMIYYLPFEFNKDIPLFCVP